MQSQVRSGGAGRSVRLPSYHSLRRSVSYLHLIAGPRTLCNACGLVYIKIVSTCLLFRRLCARLNVGLVQMKRRAKGLPDEEEEGEEDESDDD